MGSPLALEVAKFSCNHFCYNLEYLDGSIHNQNESIKNGRGDCFWISDPYLFMF